MAENSESGKSSNAGLYIFLFLLLAAIAMAALAIYRKYLQFNAQDVKDYINEEVNQYPEQVRPAVYAIIRDGVHYILSKRDLTNQVISVAKASGTPYEYELIHAAVMQARDWGYIEA
jgi:hypothetical protein